MGAGASAEAGKALADASTEDVTKVFGQLTEEQQKKVKEALTADKKEDAPKAEGDDPKKEEEAPKGKGEGKGKGGPPPMEKLDKPFGEVEEKVAVDIKDDPTHVIRFEDEEKCVRVYQPKFEKPGQFSAIHYHDEFTAYLFMGNPDKPQMDTAMEVCTECEDGTLQATMAVKMPGFPGGTCSCLFFPHPMFGKKAVHRVGIPASFPQSDAQPFSQLGCEVKAWPKAATPEALPAKPADGLPAKYTSPQMSPKTDKFQQWRLELRPGDELPAHVFAAPVMILCGCGGGGKLAAGEGGPADSPLIGLSQGDFKWLPTGCAAVGPVKLADDAPEPFVVSVVEFIKEGFS